MLKHIPPRKINHKRSQISAIYERLEKEKLLGKFLFNLIFWFLKKSFLENEVKFFFIFRCTVYESEFMKLKYVFDVHEDNYLVCFINEKEDKKK